MPINVEMLNRRIFIPGRAHCGVSVASSVGTTRAAIHAMTRSAKGTAWNYYYSNDGRRLIGYLDEVIFLSTADWWMNPYKCWVRVRLTDDGRGETTVDMRAVYPPIALVTYCFCSILTLLVLVASFFPFSLVVLAISMELAGLLFAVRVLERRRYQSVVDTLVAALGANSRGTG